MKVFVFFDGKTSACYFNGQVTCGDDQLIQEIEAEETDLPLTTDWKDPYEIAIGEVFACNGTQSNLIRTK